MLFHQPHNSMGNYHYNANFYTDEFWQPHFHKNLELIVVLSGGVTCKVNHKTYFLSAGDFGLCLPYDIHAYQPDAHTEYYVLVFSGDYVRLFQKQIEGKSANGFRFKPDGESTRFLIKKLVENREPTVYVLKSCLYTVCDEFLKHVALSESKEKKQSILAITDFLAQNHTRDIGLRDIADLLGYDYHYVSRYFHSIFNMPFAELLAAYRLETAIALMEETDKKIAEIAFESGFGSVRSLNFHFKKQFGTSPNVYKKTMLKPFSVNV